MKSNSRKSGNSFRPELRKNNDLGRRVIPFRAKSDKDVVGGHTKGRASLGDDSARPGFWLTGRGVLHGSTVMKRADA